MSKKRVPSVTIIDSVAEGNGKDGFRSEGNADIYAKNLKTRNNGGKGINIVQSKRDNKIRNWILSVSVIVAGGLILAYVFGVGR